MARFAQWLEQVPGTPQPAMAPAQPMANPAAPQQAQQPNPQQAVQQRQMALKQLQAALGPFSQALNGLQDPALKQQVSGLYTQFSQGLGKVQ